VANANDLLPWSPVDAPEPAAGAPATPEPPPVPRLKPIQRDQMVLHPVQVEQLVEPDHPVRALWELVSGLDMSLFYADIKAVEGRAGQDALDPRLLICLWVWACMEGINSAREVARRCEYHPVYQWLTGLRKVNYHSLSSFRVDYAESVDELFAQVLAVLMGEGLITLERVMVDGTKVKAAASKSSLHREPTLQKHLEQARERVRQMGDPEQEPNPQSSARQRAAQERAARERVQRMEQALAEMPKVREACGSKLPEECRVSETEPEVRKMKHNDGGFAPSYNLQLGSDAAQDIIVSVQVIQASNDQNQLGPVLDEVQRQCHQQPKEGVVDEGYLNRATVVAMDQRGVDLIAGGNLEENRDPDKAARNCAGRGVAPEFYSHQFVYDAEHDLYLCPAGQSLPHRSVKHDREGVERHLYQAPATACRTCPHQPECCPTQDKPTPGRTIVRTQNEPVVAAFVEKMKTPEAQAIYRQRKQIAEFPNLWIKEKLGLRRFRVRGLVKVRCEALWVCLTYNIQQWIRLRWKPRFVEAAAIA
jgi:transposase